MAASNVALAAAMLTHSEEHSTPAGALMDTDRNLLFGVLALQTDLIDQKQFSEACAAWATRKNVPLADVLVELGWISGEDRSDVEKLLERKLKRNGGDAHATLGTMLEPSVRDMLTMSPDDGVRQSMASFVPPANYALETLLAPVEDSGPRYSRTRLHGQGGLGRVWVAHDSDLNREVALKELRPEWSKRPEAWRRFLKEAQITGQLDHPNIVPVYELSQRVDGTQPFYTMKLVRGRTLQDAIKEHHEAREAGRSDALGLGRLLSAFVSVCNALGYAHSRGVVHRDLKPENVVLGAFGEVIVLDWGLAKVASDKAEPTEDTAVISISDNAATDATQAGRQLGTPSYMSPEQADGRIDLIDERTDVFGLGAILFSILTGRPPFAGKSTIVMLPEIAQGPMPQVRDVLPSVPKPLAAICGKAMQKSRAERYQSALELAADVGRFLADEPVMAYPESAAARALRWMRRHRTWTQAAALLLVVISVVSVVAMMTVNRSHRAERYSRVLAEQAQKAAELARDKSDSDRELAETLSVESRQRLVQLQQGHGQRLLDQDKPAAALVWFAEALRLDGSTSDTEELQRVRFGTVLGHVARPMQFYPHQSAVNSAEFSPDGTRVVTASDDRTACVWETRTGQRVGAALSHDERVRGAHFSPDGTKVVTFALDGSARVWDAATGAPLTPPLKHRGAVWSAEFSSDGRRVVTASADQTARVWDATTGDAVAGPFEHTSDVWHAVLSPDGQRVATGSSDQTARVWNLSDGSSLPPVSHAGWVRFVSFSSDGQRLATCGNDSQALVWTIADGKLVLKATLKHSAGVSRAIFSHDGHRLVTVSDGLRFVWDVESPKQLGLPQKFTSWRFNPAFSADGQWLLHRPEGHHVAILSNLTALNRSLPQWELLSPVRCARFSADGRRVVIGTLDGQVRVCDAATGEPVSPPLKHQGMVTSVAFRNDGKWIVSASRDKTSRVWDAETGAPIGPPLTHAEAIVQAWFNPAGDAVVTVSDDDTAVLWDLPSGAKRHTWTHQAPVLTARFSPEGNFVVTASRDQTAQVWDTKSGRPVGAPLRHGGWVNAAYFSPSGDRVLTVSADRTARLWNAKSGEAVGSPLTHEGEVFCGAFSPDGQSVATGGFDATVRLWSMETGALAVPPIKHSGLVETVAFSADSRWLVSASTDSSARVWDVATGTPLSPPLRHRETVWSAEFHPDGQQVLTASSDQSARLWAIAHETRSAEELRPLAELLAGFRGTDAGDLEPLERDRLLALWQEQSQHFPNEFAPQPELTMNWRRREALRAELLGLWEESHRHLHDLIQAGQDQRSWRVRRADAAMHLGLWESAIADYDRGLEEPASDARLWRQRGRAHWASGHTEQAQHDFRQASDRQPKDAALWLLRSLTVPNGTDTAAEEHFRQAVEWSELLIPRLDRRWKDRLLGWEPAGSHWNDLNDDLTRRLQSSAEDWRVWRARGFVRAMLRRWADSAADFQKATELHGSDAESWRGLARVHAELNQPDKGIAAATSAIALRGDDWSLWFLRGCLQFQTQTYDKAAADYTRAQELGASGWAIFHERGRAHTLTNKHDLAVADFTAALKLRPKDAETLTFRGMTHAGKSRHDLAIEDFNAAVELNPQSAITFYSRAESYRLQKDFDRAIADCTEAIRLDPKTELAYVNRADAYADRGDDARAMADYTEAIQINPRSTYAHTKRAAALA
jgi:WD40 repeat protein/tetratricopeptide (TPR) repeat protein/tRNA A-37 threonylcarbamoyl transferase component Bud32